MTERIAAGFKYCFYGRIDSNGYLHGNSEDGAIAGDQTGESMTRLVGGQTVPVSVGEPEIVNVLGDDEPLTDFTFESANLPGGVMELAVRNVDFEAVANQTKVRTLGDLKMATLQPSDRGTPSLALLFMRRSKKWASGVQGVAAWECLLAPRAVVTPLYSDFTQRAHNPYRYGVTLSKSDRHAWGASYTELVDGTTAAPLAPVDSDNPVMIHAWKGDGAETDFNLAYAPKTAAKVHVIVDGVLQTVTAHYTVSGSTVSFGGAPASDAVINALYEIDEGDLS